VRQFRSRSYANVNRIPDFGPEDEFASASVRKLVLRNSFISVPFSGGSARSFCPWPSCVRFRIEVELRDDAKAARAVYPVNPKRPTVLGVKAYPRIADV